MSVNIYSNSHSSFDIFISLPFVLKWDVPSSKMDCFLMAAQIMSYMLFHCVGKSNSRRLLSNILKLAYSFVYIICCWLLLRTTRTSVLTFATVSLSVICNLYIDVDVKVPSSTSSLTSISLGYSQAVNFLLHSSSINRLENGMAKLLMAD